MLSFLFPIILYFAGKSGKKVKKKISPVRELVMNVLHIVPVDAGCNGAVRVRKKYPDFLCIKYEFSVFGYNRDIDMNHSLIACI